MEGSDISFTNEVINRTARELNLTPKTIEYLYKFSLEYMYKQMNSTDCCSFRLPGIGTLYAQSKYIDDVIIDKIRELEKDPKNTEARKTKLAFQYKREAIDEYLLQSGRPRSSITHFMAEKIKTRYYNHGKKIEEMQDVQNTTYNIINEKNLGNN